MEPGWIATIIVIVINIFGWGVTFGRFNGRVKSLEDIAERHENILSGDGVLGKMAALQSDCSKLQGTIQTYIDLTKKGG